MWGKPPSEIFQMGNRVYGHVCMMHLPHGMRYITVGFFGLPLIFHTSHTKYHTPSFSLSLPACIVGTKYCNANISLIGGTYFSSPYAWPPCMVRDIPPHHTPHLIYHMPYKQHNTRHTSHCLLHHCVYVCIHTTGRYLRAYQHPWHTHTPPSPCHSPGGPCSGLA